MIFSLIAATALVSNLESKPNFWQVRTDEIVRFCEQAKKCDKKEILCHTPAGFPVYALFYGDFSEGEPQTNWSAGESSTTYHNYTARPVGAKQTFLLLTGVHGAEPECVAGAMNLLKMLETGSDFRGRSDPELLKLIAQYRLIVVPCLNMDGRSVSPDHLRGVDWDTFRRVSQGVWKNGERIGWRGSKSYFPLPLDRVSFRGGYPNSEGFNLMHDACPGHIRTEEVRSLLRLVERWRVDAILNGHSYEFAPSVIPPTTVMSASDLKRVRGIRYRINRELFKRGLLCSEPQPPPPAADEPEVKTVNLNNAMAMASGALALTLECSVSYDRPDRGDGVAPPRRTFTFDELMEPVFVAMKEYLRDGLEKPFLVRGSETLRGD